MDKVNEVEVVLKVVERCNLDCHYCYFFYSGNENYKKHPPLISETTLLEVIDYLNEAVCTMSIRKIRVDLHGGEPLMLGKKRFRGLCASLREKVRSEDLEITVQTNGTLLDGEWVDVLRDHRVAVGVSLDGPKDINDAHRADRKGKGSYERIVRGIELLRTSGLAPSLLCVIDPKTDGRKVYRHFVDDLGISGMDFLLPDKTHDNYREEDVDGCARYLMGVYDEWASDNNKAISVRFINRALFGFTAGDGIFDSSGAMRGVRKAIVKIASNGDVDPSDLLHATSGEFFGRFNCSTSTLAEFFADEAIRSAMSLDTNAPDKCRECCWLAVCGGGEAQNRYLSGNGFNRPSIYCSAYKSLYSHIAAHLMASNTVRRDRIVESLGMVSR